MHKVLYISGGAGFFHQQYYCNHPSRINHGSCHQPRWRFNGNGQPFDAAEGASLVMAVVEVTRVILWKKVILEIQILRPKNLKGRVGE